MSVTGGSSSSSPLQSQMSFCQCLSKVTADGVGSASVCHRSQLMGWVQPGPGVTEGDGHTPVGGTLSVLLHSCMCLLAGSSLLS